MYVYVIAWDRPARAASTSGYHMVTMELDDLHRKTAKKTHPLEVRSKQFQSVCFHGIRIVTFYVWYTRDIIEPIRTRNNQKLVV